MSETFGTIDLELKKVVAQMGLSDQALTISTEPDLLMNMTLVRLVRMVATLPGDETITVPETWFDHFLKAEARRSPIARWVARRRPIQVKTFRAIEWLPTFPTASLDKYRNTARVAVWEER